MFQSFRIDCNEQAASAGENFIFLVVDFRGVDVFTSLDFQLKRFDAQGSVKRDRLQIVDRDLGGESNDVTALVDLAHGLVEDGGDDAAMAVSRRSGVTLAKTKAAKESISLFVVDEFHAHAARVVGSAGEALVLLELNVASVVSVSLGPACHRRILYDGAQVEC